MHCFDAKWVRIMGGGGVTLMLVVANLANTK